MLITISRFVEMSYEMPCEMALSNWDRLSVTGEDKDGQLSRLLLGDGYIRDLKWKAADPWGRPKEEKQRSARNGESIQRADTIKKAHWILAG